jgi:pimeloyl-ACP methyl ester carboxylesterase
MKLSVILIHGIGGSSESWAEPVIEKLQKKTLTELKNILKDKAPTNISEVLAIKSVYWKTALQKPQNELQSVLARYFGWVIQGLNAWDSLFKWAFKAFYKYQNMIVTLFIGDIVGYMAKEGKIGIDQKVDAAMEALAAESSDKNKPLTFISHSLGTVIASNYIFDKMNAHRKNGVNRMDERFIFSNMFTAGSPIALFSMKFNGPESFNLPVEVEDPSGRWINILDKDDPIAMPLRLLNSSYQKAVFSDYQVNSGWFWGTAHTEYFTKTNTLDLIARKLAIDWAAINQKIEPPKIAALYEAYDRTVGAHS